MERSYIGLGSNLNNPELQLNTALERLGDIKHTTLITCSSFYISKPLGPGQQPDFVNAVALLKSGLSALKLLAQLHLIEDSQGRVRGQRRWRPRTLDLDLLLYGAQIIDNHMLKVPHPEIKSRSFVLIPLLELDPEIAIPRLGRAKDLLRYIGAGGTRKLMDG